MLRQSDLVVNKQRIDFNQMLQDQDVATAIKTLIAILKRQTVQVFKLESDLCSLTEHRNL